MRSIDRLRKSVSLPAVCAPMYRISSPSLAIAACTGGLVGALPRHNVRELDEFEEWLCQIDTALARFREQNPGARIGPLAVNLSRMPDRELDADIATCVRHGVRLFISAMGNPRELALRVHDAGGEVWHDVTSLEFAHKAIDAGVDGLTCIGSGGGGHSGTLSPLVLIPKVRAMFDGVIVMAGAVAHGAAVRAAEVLGADLAYIGTRFIATPEANAPHAYKEMLASAGADDLTFAAFGSAPANWLSPSLELAGATAAEPLPDGVRPWRDLWSAGQGVELIDDTLPAGEIIEQLKREYAAACARPGLARAGSEIQGSAS